MRRIAGLLRRALTFWLPSSIRYRRTAQKIRDSGLFDTTFYLDCYPDVSEGSLDPVQHFVRYGAAEGRNPHPLFDTLYYLNQCPDVVDAGFNPLSHFVTHGWSEGRNPSPACDLASHLARHPSLRESGAEPLAQLLTNAAAWQPPPVPQAEPGPSIPTISLSRLMVDMQRQHGNRFVQRSVQLARAADRDEAGADVERQITTSRGGGQALDSGVARSVVGTTRRCMPSVCVTKWTRCWMKMQPSLSRRETELQRTG